MSQMRGIVVDPVQQTAVVQGPVYLLLPQTGPALVCAHTLQPAPLPALSFSSLPLASNCVAYCAAWVLKSFKVLH